MPSFQTRKTAAGLRLPRVTYIIVSEYRETLIIAFPAPDFRCKAAISLKIRALP